MTPRLALLVVLLLSGLGSVALAAGQAPFDFEIEYRGTRWGQSVFVSGDLPELGGGRIERAIKLEPTEFPLWKLPMALPARTRFQYRYLLRDDAPSRLSDPGNGTFISGPLQGHTCEAARPPPHPWTPLPPGQHTPSRIVVHEAVDSPQLGNSRALRVYLPPGYDDRREQAYPVLYLHDGQNLFRPGGPFGCWDVERALDSLVSAGRIPPLVCVGVDNTPARMTEYVPPYSAIDGKPGTGDLYCRFLIEHVAPFVEKRYRIASDRRQRIIGGSSLGGLISAYLGWHHPEFASRLLCMSPSFQIGEILERFETQPARPVAFYFDSGDQGPSHDSLVHTLHARDALLGGARYRLGANLYHAIGYGHGHNEAAWRERFGEALSTLLR